jgi:hypothetical protein
VYAKTIHAVSAGQIFRPKYCISLPSHRKRRATPSHSLLLLDIPTKVCQNNSIQCLNYRLADRWSRFDSWDRQRFLFGSAPTHTTTVSKPHNRRVQRSLRYGITRPGREANQPPRSSAQVKYDNVPLSFNSMSLN